MVIFHLLSPTAWALDTDSSRWSNRDMDPVPTHQRTWTAWNIISYWVSDAANIASWEVASSMLAIGLSWKQALPAMAIGYTLLAMLIVLNGTIGARLHVPFPVLARSSFGFWFSYVAVVVRIVVGMCWFGIFCYTGSECIYQMLKSLWPRTADIENRLPHSSRITSVGLITYVIYWLIQFPFMFVSPHSMRRLFLVKAIVVPIAWIAILVWSMIRVPSALNQLDSTFQRSGDTSWSFLSAINTSLGGWLTLALNIPDFTRYVRNERDQYVQLALLPPVLTFVGFLGIAVTSAGNVLYGQMLWDPLQLIDHWTNRPATFFMAFSFALATLGTNISANSLSVANNMTALCPRYINIRRGQIICAILGGWAFCPWEILASAQGFLAFIAGYTVFLGPFVAIIAADYWVVHKGKVDIPGMYEPQGRYRYWHGINWRAVLAIAVSVPPGIPGLIKSLTSSEQDAAFHIFQFDSIFGFCLSFIVYSLVSWAVPAKETFVDEAKE